MKKEKVPKKVFVKNKKRFCWPERARRLREKFIFEFPIALKREQKDTETPGKLLGYDAFPFSEKIIGIFYVFYYVIFSYRRIKSPM